MEIFVRNTFVSIYDIQELQDEYYKIKKKKYDDNPMDEVMISLLRKYNNEFKIVKIEKYLIPYIKIISYITHQKIEIDYNAYKIDLIKKILSSENELSDIIISIEYVLFT